jgi:hypothetical protein
MRARLLVGITFCLSLLTVLTTGQENKKIPASQAAQHIGEHATVCGSVESARYLANSRGKPTFLNIGKAYPDQDFTVVIWSEDRAKFGHPEDRLIHKHICVSGQIELYRGKPQIVAKNESQIAVD